MTTFKNPNDPDNRVITAKVQEWIRTKMNLGEEALVQVLELNCADPGCMDKETRILVTVYNQPMRQFRIHKPLVYVRKPDIDQLVENNTK